MGMNTRINRFGRDLLDTLEGDRIFLSPFGIYTTLASLAHGADEGSATSRELLRALYCASIHELHEAARGMSATVEGNGRFRSANLILVDSTESKEKGVAPEFKDSVSGLFGTAVDTADFKSDSALIRERIREWAKESTDGMIGDFESQVSADTMAAILNAVVFKDKWFYFFDPDDSSTEIFHNADGTVTKQRMMSNSLTQPEHYAQDDRFRMLGLRYMSGCMMYILLPLAGDDLHVLDEWRSESPEYRESFMSENAMEVDELKIVLPRFEMTCDYNLKDALADLGIERSLSDDAEYTRIIEGAQLKIGSAKHKAKIRVDEMGTEAAAVTEAVMVGCTAMPPAPPVQEFVCDIPFIFSICAEDGTMLFTGYYGSADRK